MYSAFNSRISRFNTKWTSCSAPFGEMCCKKMKQLKCSSIALQVAVRTMFTPISFLLIMTTTSESPRCYATPHRTTFIFQLSEWAIYQFSTINQPVQRYSCVRFHPRFWCGNGKQQPHFIFLPLISFYTINIKLFISEFLYVRETDRH